MRKQFFGLLLSVLSICSLAQSPKEKQKGWHLLDQQQDGYMGISLNKAYEFLKGKKSTTVIVAVIDSGIDTAHEDLKNNLWRNEKEVAGNGKDDDGNGYVDDLHGWNFCGSKEGENLSRNSHEIARVYHNWKREFENKIEKDISKDKIFLYGQWVKAAAIISEEYEDAKKQLPHLQDFITALEQSAKVITEHLKSAEFTVAQIKPLGVSKEEKLLRAAAIWTELFSRTSDPAITNTAVMKELANYKNSFENKIKRKEEAPEDTRGSLTKDIYTDINDRFYGNNNLTAGSGHHGTLVAGVIGAVRNNNLGIDGIVNDVKIMAIRAVPGGDEHDKDVALAIRYAVDNGAKIINMSFGKPVSPYKQFVDEAVRYAASKGVLLVHGSGNDGKDIDKDIFYPNPVFLDGTTATNYLTVGASGDPSTGGYAASFSNYSDKWVDIFAPGMYIYSTANENIYEAADGTSLASPVVTGVAALLKSYYPQLTPEQIIRIIKNSGTNVNEEVTIPGDEKKTIKFSRLSSSGRIINAFEAVKMAEGMK